MSLVKVPATAFAYQRLDYRKKMAALVQAVVPSAQPLVRFRYLFLDLLEEYLSRFLAHTRQVVRVQTTLTGLQI